MQSKNIVVIFELVTKSMIYNFTLLHGSFPCASVDKLATNFDKNIKTIALNWRKLARPFVTTGQRRVIQREIVSIVY